MLYEDKCFYSDVRSRIRCPNILWTKIPATISPKAEIPFHILIYLPFHILIYLRDCFSMRLFLSSPILSILLICDSQTFIYFVSYKRSHEPLFPQLINFSIQIENLLLDEAINITTQVIDYIVKRKN